MRLTSAATRSSALRRRRSSRSVSLRPVSRSWLDHLVGVLAGSAACSRTNSLQLVVGDLDVELARRPPRARARARPSVGLGAELLLSSLGRLAGELEVVSGLMPRRSSERDEAVPEVGGARVDERAARARPATPRRARRAPRRGSAASISSSSCSRSRPSMSARSSASVSNSLAARASSSSIGGRTFSLISLTVTSTSRARLVGELDDDRLRLAGGHARRGALDLLDEPAGAELDDEVALGLAGRARRRRSRGCRPAAAGRPSTGRELGDASAQRLELARRSTSSGTSGSATRHLELRPVGDLGLRLHGDGRGELPVVVGRRPAGRSRTRAARPGGCGAPAAACQNQPPMWLSTASP